MLKAFDGLIEILKWLLGILIYIWTLIIAYDYYGIIGSIITFFLPGVGQIFWAFMAYREFGLDSSYIQWLIVLVLLWLIKFVVVILISRKENRVGVLESSASIEVINTENQNTKFLYGFGGWLIIYAIGLILAVIRSARYIVDELIPFINSGMYSDLLREDSRWGIVTLIEFFSHFLVIGFTLIIGYFCLKQSKFFLKASKFFLILNPIITLIGYFAYLLIPETAEVSTQTLYAFFQSIIYSGVWYAYLSKSKRVANTYL